MAHYKVTGDLNPDATGTYVETGTYLGSPAYRREDGNYWIWSPGGDMWTLSTEPGELDPGYWAGSIPGIAQVYDPVDDYTGDATVALIVYAVQIWDGEVLIIDGRVAVHEDCCCEEKECTWCTDDRAPIKMQVTMSGVTDVGCDECDTLNDTFVLDWFGEIAYNPWDTCCVWYYEFDPILCVGGDFPIKYLIAYVYVGDWAVGLHDSINPRTCAAVIFNFPAGADCLTYDETDDFKSFTPICSAAGVAATARLLAL